MGEHLWVNVPIQHGGCISSDAIFTFQNIVRHTKFRRNRTSRMTHPVIVYCDRGNKSQYCSPKAKGHTDFLLCLTPMGLNYRAIVSKIDALTNYNCWYQINEKTPVGDIIFTSQVSTYLMFLWYLSFCLSFFVLFWRKFTLLTLWWKIN